MPIDLRSFARTSDHTWLERHEKRLQAEGNITLDNMICAMAKALDEVPIGKYIDIEKSVKPENREVFIKVACDYMDTETDYRFNRLMNRVYHDEPIIFLPQKNLTKDEQTKRQAMDRARRRLPA